MVSFVIVLYYLSYWLRSFNIQGIYLFLRNIQMSYLSVTGLSVLTVFFWLIWGIPSSCYCRLTSWSDSVPPWVPNSSFSSNYGVCLISYDFFSFNSNPFFFSFLDTFPIPISTIDGQIVLFRCIIVWWWTLSIILSIFNWSL